METNTPLYSYTFEHPSVTADCVVFGLDGKTLNVLLIERGIEPYNGKFALPGSFIKMNETAEEGAIRTLNEETNVKDIYLEQFHTFTAVDRDLRKDENTGLPVRVMTIAFLAFIRQDDYSIAPGKNEKNVQWIPVAEIEEKTIVKDGNNEIERKYVKKELPKLAFDHNEIIEMALTKLHHKIMFEPIAFHLLNESFKMSELQTIYELVIGKTLDRRNFQKKMNKLEYVKLSEDKAERCVGRPSALFNFNEEKFKENIEEMTIF